MARSRAVPDPDRAGAPQARRRARPADRRAAPPAQVRMYRHGLGDCFLLRFPRPDDRDFRVLIDCGVIQGTPRVPGQPDPLERVVADLGAATTDAGSERPTIDVLVATHEHWDHLSGFATLTGEFDRFDVRRVWLAWTEDPNDPVAERLREDRKKRVQALATHLAGTRKVFGLDGRSPEAVLGADREVLDDLGRVAAVLSFFGIDPHAGAGLGAAGAGRLSVREAMDWCRHHQKVQFFRPGEVIDLRDEVDGLLVYVLGPPSDLRQLLKDLPTKTGRETYEDEVRHPAAQAFFGADVGGPDGQDTTDVFEPAAPFDQKYRIVMRAAAGIDFYRTHYFGTGAGMGEEWRRIDATGLAEASGFALKLDSDTNNTSLALAFELTPPGREQPGPVLLFPGDAQVGNWESWHAGADGKERVWVVSPAEGAGGAGRKVTAKDLLARTVLYKVGHHGSHNATLRGKGLEMMTHPDLVALVPVDTYVAHEKKHWARIPFDPLMDALRRRAGKRVIMADQPLAAMRSGPDFQGRAVDAEELIKVEGPGGEIVSRPLWVEYSLPPLR